MPKEVFDKDYAFLPHASLLTFEEITRLARLFVAHGVRKIRLTGGEPLLRKNLEMLVAHAGRAAHAPTAQPLDLTLTTNGSLLARKAQALKDAGPAARDGQPRRARRRGLPAHERRRLPGGRGARGHRRGAARPASARSRSTWSSSAAPTTHEILPMARHFQGTRQSCCASSSTWTSAPPTAGAWTRCCPRPRWSSASHAEFPLEPLEPSAAGETAERWRYADGGGEIGVISQRHAGLLPRLQPRAPVDRRQALPVPVRHPRPRPARAAARRRHATTQIAAAIGHDLAAAATTAIPSCAARCGRDARSRRRAASR